MIRPLINKTTQLSNGNIDPINQNIRFCDWLITQLQKQEIKETNINQTLKELTPEYVRFIKNKPKFESVSVDAEDIDQLKLAINRAFMFFKSVCIDKNYTLKKKYSDKTKLEDAFRCLSDNVDKLTESINDKIYIELDANKDSFISSKAAVISSIANDGAHWLMFSMKQQYERTIHNIYTRFKQAQSVLKNKKDAANYVLSSYVNKELSKTERKNIKTGEINIYQPWMIQNITELAQQVLNHLATKNAQTESDLLTEFNKNFKVPLMALYYAYSRYNTKIWKENDENRTRAFQVLMQEYIDNLKIDPSIETNMIQSEKENINMFKDKYYSLNMLKDRTDCSDIKIGALNKESINGKTYLALNFPKIKWKNQQLLEYLSTCLDPNYLIKQMDFIHQQAKSLPKTDINYKLYKELKDKVPDALSYIITGKLRELYPVEATYLATKNVPTIVEWFYTMTKLLSAKTNEIYIIKNLFGKYYNNDEKLSYSQTEKRWVPIQYDFSQGQLLINTQCENDGSPHFTATGYRADGVELIEIGKDKNGTPLYHLETIEPAVYLNPDEFKKEEILSNISHVLNCLPKGIKLSQIKSIGITSATIMDDTKTNTLNINAKASFTGEDYVILLEKSIKYMAQQKGIYIPDNEIMDFVLNTPIYHHTVNPLMWIKDPNISHLKNLVEGNKNNQIVNTNLVDTVSINWNESLLHLTYKDNWSDIKKRYYNYLKSKETNKENIKK